MRSAAGSGRRDRGAAGRLLALLVLLGVADRVRSAVLKPSINDCLKNLPPLSSLSLDVNKLVSILPVAEESCQCVGRAGGAITEVFAALFTQQLGFPLPECLLKAVRRRRRAATTAAGRLVGAGVLSNGDDASANGPATTSTYSFLEGVLSTLVSEITNDILFGHEEARGAHDSTSL